MTTCPECSGSGLELAINGEATGRCRACKGVGLEPVTCPRLGDMVCTQAPGPHPYGCVYEASSTPDGHDDTEAAAEATR